MKKETIILICLLLIISRLGAAEEPQERKWLYPHLLSDSIKKNCGPESPVPNLKNVALTVHVDYDEGTKVFSYRYTLKNGSNSVGCLEVFEIDISRPEGSVELSDMYMKDYPRYVNKRISSGDVPVAFPDLPRRTFPSIGEVTIWDAAVPGRGVAVWGASLEQLIPPGEELSGFVMTSHGLPAVRDFEANPDYDPSFEDVMNKFGITLEEANTGVEYFEKFDDAIAFHGKTIGPTAPPAELDTAAFLNNIIAMKHEAFKLGWITKEAIELSLDQKLEHARAKLEAGQTKTASNILGAFVNEVEAQGCESYDKCPEGKALKPEAYALLKYNAQYLIDNLK